MGTLYAAPSKVEDDVEHDMVGHSLDPRNHLPLQMQPLADDIMKVPIAKDMRRRGGTQTSHTPLLPLIPRHESDDNSGPFNSFGGNYGGSYGGGPFGGFNGGYGNGISSRRE